ncbi:MAG: hypothetical protein ACR2PI_20630 [Hyphomicrobiaceae bacterium]
MSTDLKSRFDRIKLSGSLLLASWRALTRGRADRDIQRKLMMPGQHPELDEKRKAALEAIDQARQVIDQALENGDDDAAEDLLNKIKQLAQEIDNMASEEPDPSKS